MEIFGNKKQAKKSIEYCCENCDYLTCKKNNYKTHLQTMKHKRICLETKTSKIKHPQHQCICGKKYNNNSGLWKHEKKCPEIEKSKKERIPEVNHICIIFILSENKNSFE